MPKFPSDGTAKALLDALKTALRGIEEVRVSSSGVDEAERLTGLKQAIRAKIAHLEEEQKEP